MEYAHEELMNEMGIGQNDVPSEIKKQIISFAPTKQIDILKMKWFIDQVLHNLPKVDKKPEKRVSKTISLEEMMNKVINRIRQNMSISFKTLNKEHKEKKNVIISFLAILELVKLGNIDANQHNTFEDILKNSKVIHKYINNGLF